MRGDILPTLGRHGEGNMNMVEVGIEGLDRVMFLEVGEIEEGYGKEEKENCP